MKLYTGFDLHSSSSYLGIIDEDGKRIWKKKLRNDPILISKTLRRFKKDIDGIVVESTYNWYWAVDLMIEEGYHVHLANPSRIQQYSGLKHADDEHDAFWLAEMLRLKILPEGYIYPKDQRPLRDLLRKRGHLVRLRTSLITSLQNILARNVGSKMNTNSMKALTEDRVTPLLAGNEVYGPGTWVTLYSRYIGNTILGTWVTLFHYSLSHRQSFYNILHSVNFFKKPSYQKITIIHIIYPIINFFKTYIFLCQCMTQRHLISVPSEVSAIAYPPHIIMRWIIPVL